MNRRRRRTPKPDSAERWFESGLAKHDAGDLEGATRAYVRATELEPEASGAWSMLGIVALQTGKPNEAVAPLERAVAIDPDVPGNHVNLGNALRGVGRADEALASYRTAVKLDESLAAAHNNIGNVHRDANAVADALSAYTRACEVDPDFFAASSNRANALRAADASREEQLAAFRNALEIAQRHGLDTANVADCHNALALLLGEEDCEAATEHLRTAIAIDPAFAEAHLSLATKLRKAGELTDAVVHYERAIALAPDRFVSAYKPLFHSLRKLGREDEATRVIHAWHAAAPDDAIAAHLSRSRSSAPPPSRATDEYIAREFDGFAEVFDSVLVDKLDYRGPAIVEQALRSRGATSWTGKTILDAGCGTGLCAPFLRPWAQRLVGVDLSAKMLDKARGRELYDALLCEELTAFLEGSDREFDAIVAADVLIYFGDLAGVLRAMAKTTRVGGVVAVTAEAHSGSDSGWSLAETGRYCHSLEYFRDQLVDAGFEDVRIEPAEIRAEGNARVPGWVATALRGRK